MTLMSHDFCPVVSTGSRTTSPAGGPTAFQVQIVAEFSALEGACLEGGGGEFSADPRIQRLVVSVFAPQLFQEAVEVVEVRRQAHGQEDADETRAICAVQCREVGFELWK